MNLAFLAAALLTIGAERKTKTRYSFNLFYYCLITT